MNEVDGFDEKQQSTVGTLPELSFSIQHLEDQEDRGFLVLVSLFFLLVQPHCLRRVEQKQRSG
jgi:hypothetical protein